MYKLYSILTAKAAKDFSGVLDIQKFAKFYSAFVNF